MAAVEDSRSKPFTNNQLRKLGRSIACHDPMPSVESEDLYSAFLSYFDQVQVEVTGRLRELDLCAVIGRHFEWDAVGRTKSLATLTDKLRRGSELDTIRDIAGARIVADCTIDEQDTIGAFLSQEFGGAKRVDRRAEPVSGYRALHLEIRHMGVRVEIQIRTRLQHGWADLYERLADQWGRSIRYDQPPEHRDAAQLERRMRVVERIHDISDLIADVEALDNRIASMPWWQRFFLAAETRDRRRLHRRMDELLEGLSARLGLGPHDGILS